MKSYILRMPGLDVPPILDVSEIQELKEHAKRYLKDQGFTQDPTFEEQTVRGELRIRITCEPMGFVGKIEKLY